MKDKLRGAPKQRAKRESFIRFRPDESSRLPARMSRAGESGGGGHLRDEQVARAKEIVGKLKARFVSLSALERASAAAGLKLKQQTMSVLLGNGQVGYSIAQRIMAFAKTLPEFEHVPRNYILGGTDGGSGTEPAPHYALRPMKYRAKGELLDRLSLDLPGEFLDFTASREPRDTDASAWTRADWFRHVSREFEVWKLLEEEKKRR